MAKNTPAAAPVAAPEAPRELDLPKSGGAWVRNPDGTLSRDPSEHPEEAPSAEAKE